MSNVKAAVLCITGVLLVVAIAVGIWVVSVVTSTVTGKGEAFKQKNSAGNRIVQQAFFEDTYADIVQSDAKLAALAADYKGAPSAETRTRLVGVKTYCLSQVGAYNAAARKYLAEDFRAIDLPAQIDTNDPTTDCQESKS